MSRASTEAALAREAQFARLFGDDEDDAALDRATREGEEEEEEVKEGAETEAELVSMLEEEYAQEDDNLAPVAAAPRPSVQAAQQQPPPAEPAPSAVTRSMDQDVRRLREQVARTLQMLQDAMDTSLLARADASSQLGIVKQALSATQATLVALQRQYEDVLKFVLVHVYEQDRLQPSAEDNGAALFAAVYRR
jgi:hypothetical protein